MTMKWVAVLLLALQDPQAADPTLEELIRKMEAQAAAVRPLSFTVESSGTPSHDLVRMEGGVGADGRVVLKRVASADEARAGHVLLLDGPEFELRMEWDGRSQSQDELVSGAGWRCQEVPWKVIKDIRLLLWFLSPARMMAQEKNATLLGRRTLDGRPAFVILARRWSDVQRNVRVWVGCDDLRVRRVDVLSILWESRCYVTATKEVNGVPVPVEWREEGRSRSSYWAAANRVVTSLTDLARKEPAAPARDLDAPTTFKSLEEVRKALVARPGDPELHYAWALGRLRALSSIEREDEEEETPITPEEFAAAARELEKAVATSWTPSPLRALMAANAGANDLKAQEQLLQRIEKMAVRPGTLTLDAAWRLNDLGQYDRALALLKDVKDVPASRVAEERMIALLSKGDVAAAMEEFLATLGLLAHPQAWIDRLETLQDAVPAARREALGQERFLKALDGPIAKAPKLAALRLARLKIAGDDASARAILEHVADKAIRKAALAFLRTRAGEMTAQEFESFAAVLKPEGVDGAAAAALDVVRGLALAKLEKKDEARTAFERALGGGLEVAELQSMAAVVEALGDDALTERVCRRCVDAAHAEEVMGDWSFVSNDEGPVQTLARLYSKQRRPADFYHVVKRLDVFGGEGVYVFFSLRTNLPGFMKTAEQEAMRDPAELPGLKWLARCAVSIDAQFRGAMHGELPDLVKLYEKGREWAPKDLEVIQGLAMAYAGRNDREKALGFAEELARLYAEGAAPGEGGWSPARVQLAIAEAQQKLGNIGAVKEILTRLVPEGQDLKPDEYWLADRLAEECSQPERSVAVLTRLEEEAFRPSFRLGQMHEKAKRYEEAVRHYNRAIAEGYDSPPDPQAEGRMIRIRRLVPESERATPQRARGDLLKRLGQDYFIQRLFDRKLPAMTSAEEAQARLLFEQLGSDDLEAREAASAGLEEMGVKAAPVLRPGLTSKSDEIRSRVWMLLSRWADPK